MKMLMLYATGDEVRHVQRLGGRPRAARVPARLRGGPAARLRLGHAQHQQPQRADPEEELPGRAALLQQVRARVDRRTGAPATRHLRQGAQETARSFA